LSDFPTTHAEWLLQREADLVQSFAEKDWRQVERIYGLLAIARLSVQSSGAGTDLTPLITAVKNAGKVTAASIGAVTTSGTGATFVALTAGACTEVILNNTASTAVDIEYRRNGTGAAMLVPSGAIAVVEAISDTSDIEVRRVDQSNTVSTFGFERKTR
jgi:hypothetical protein